MKKTIFLLILALLSVSSINAQSSFSELLDKFRNKELSYSDLDEDRLGYYVECIFNDYLTYKYKILDAPSFKYRRAGTPNIEIEQNENIYTYPTVFRSEEEDDEIVFYNTKVSPKEVGYFFDNIHGAQYSTHLVTMDKIKIGKQNADIRACFSPLFKNDSIELIEPTNYIKNSQYPNKLLLTVNVTYAGKPSVIYTPPQYAVFAGRLLEVNSGINYDVPLYEVSHLCIVNTTTMNSELITLEGISNIFMKYDTNGEQIYFMNRSEYGKNDTYRGKRKHIAISQNQSPIYIASMDNSSNGNIILKTAIIPKEGDVITDIQRSADGEYIYLCGSTTKQGYVGYENGILIILKKTDDTYKEIARYICKNKDRYYIEIEALDDYGNICLKYDEWQDGMRRNNFDIINIPSIINKEQ